MCLTCFEVSGKVTQGKAIIKEAGPINRDHNEITICSSGQTVEYGHVDGRRSDEGGWEELKSKGEKKVKA